MCRKSGGLLECMHKNFDRLSNHDTYWLGILKACGNLWVVGKRNTLPSQTNYCQSLFRKRCGVWKRFNGDVCRLWICWHTNSIWQALNSKYSHEIYSFLEIVHMETLKKHRYAWSIWRWIKSLWMYQSFSLSWKHVETWDKSTKSLWG